MEKVRSFRYFSIYEILSLIENDKLSQKELMMVAIRYHGLSKIAVSKIADDDIKDQIMRSNCDRVKKLL